MTLTVAVVPRAGSRQRPSADVSGKPGNSWLSDIWPEETWDVVCLHDRCGVEVEQPLASFSHRRHAEAFLDDLLATGTLGRGDPGYGPERF